MSKNRLSEATLYNVKAGELSLSVTALSELLQAVLARGLPFRFRAKGVSMYPFLKDDDVITVSPLFRRSLRFGDVAVFVQPKTDKVLVHRVVGKRRNAYLMKGDNSYYFDGLILKEQILGYVTKQERNGKVTFFGLGLHRFAIALLSRNGLLLPLLFYLRKFMCFITRKTIL